MKALIIILGLFTSLPIFAETYTGQTVDGNECFLDLTEVGNSLFVTASNDVVELDQVPFGVTASFNKSLYHGISQDRLHNDFKIVIESRDGSITSYSILHKSNFFKALYSGEEVVTCIIDN